mmetsp:Transcript_10029/g.28112  ORF Transcript_10029/g.28112 Transcript_10029/m.28112 type:complete len:93 (-) Transcript_10029:66-344(-)
MYRRGRVGMCGIIILREEGAIDIVDDMTIRVPSSSFSLMVFSHWGHGSLRCIQWAWVAHKLAELPPNLNSDRVHVAVESILKMKLSIKVLLL